MVGSEFQDMETPAAAPAGRGSGRKRGRPKGSGRGRATSKGTSPSPSPVIFCQSILSFSRTEKWHFLVFRQQCLLFVMRKSYRFFLVKLKKFSHAQMPFFFIISDKCFVCFCPFFTGIHLQLLFTAIITGI